MSKIKLKKKKKQDTIYDYPLNKIQGQFPNGGKFTDSKQDNYYTPTSSDKKDLNKVYNENIQKQNDLRLIQSLQEKSKEKYEPNQYVKNTKAGLSLGQLVQPFNLPLKAIATGADLETSLRYALDGQYKKAGEDLLQAGIQWIPFLKGSSAMKQGTYNLSDLDKLINLGISGTQKGSDIKTITEIKKSGGSISQQGYRDNSPYRNRKSININTPTGLIDMSETGIPILANGRYLPPYSGLHQFEPGVVKEERIMQDGGWMEEEGKLSANTPKEFNFETQGKVKPSMLKPIDFGDTDEQIWLENEQHHNLTNRALLYEKERTNPNRTWADVLTSRFIFPYAPESLPNGSKSIFRKGSSPIYPILDIAGKEFYKNNYNDIENATMRTAWSQKSLDNLFPDKKLKSVFPYKNGGNMNIYRDGGFNSLPQVFADGGISRFEVPVQQAQGLDAFKLPYNEIATALLSKQKSYDTQEAEMAENQAFLADLKSGYRTAGLPQEIQKEYNSKFQNYIGQDLTDPNVKRSLVQDIVALKNDGRLRTLAADIKQSALWDAYQQAHPDLAGAAINPYKQGDQWIPAKDDKGNWLNESQVNNWYGNITPYTDFNKPIDDAYTKVKANVLQTLTDSGIKVYHDDVTGKDFFYKDISKQKKQFIDETLPQWQSALEEQTTNFLNSATPEARTFNARFAKEIAADPDFTKKYISTAGGKYVYKQEENEDVSKQVGSSSGSSGSGSEKPIKTASPFKITQITKTNPNLQGYKLPQEAIKEIDNSINQYITNEGKGLTVVTNDKGQKEFTIPANATIDQINEIQAKNAQLAETQRQKQNLVDINNIVASKHGFKPNALGEYDILSQIPANLQQEVKNAYNAALRQQEAYNNQTQGSSMTGASVYQAPPPNPSEVVKNVMKKDKRFKAYLDDLEAISKGVELTGGNAYPLVGDEFKDVNSGIMNLLTQKTNYFDGKKGDIEYLQNNNSISDGDKEYVSKLIAEKGLAELNGRTSIFWDREKGEYSALAIFPRSKSDGGDLYLKISQNLLGGLPTEAMKLDPIFNESSRQLFRKIYEDHSQATNNIHGKIGGVTKDIETTHIMANDLDGKANKLNVGDTVFTIPELPNIVIKVGAFDSMDKFMREYEAAKPQGTALLDLLKSNGMTPITSPGFYNRYKSREFKGSFSPKQ